MAVVAIVNARRGAHPDRSHDKQLGQPVAQPVGILVHAINDDRCVGCDACVAVCPTNVLDLINNKSRVLRFEDCIQCEQCMWACPTEALVMHPDGTEPPPIQTPEINENFETGVPGQYLIGEVAGKPLVKNAANLGRAVVEHMLSEGGLQPGAGGGDVYDVAIVGSGPGGLSAALTCIRNGLKYIVLEKEQMIASTVSRYPKGKWVMAEPYDVRNLSYLPVFDSSKEQMVPIWEEVVERAGMNLKKGEPVEGVTKGDDGIFDLKTTQASYRAQRVVLAIGTRGKPRTLGVPGENLPKVASLLEDPDDFRGQAVLVIGGGDSALEAAMALADSGARVVLSYRGKSFSRAQKKNQSAIDSYDSQKRIKVLYSSNVVQFTEDTVTIKLVDGQEKSYPNEAAFVLIGAEPPVRWLAKVGVHVVERPHSFSLGKSDEVIERLAASKDLLECPEEAEAAVYLAKEGSLPAEVQQQMEQAASGKTMMFGSHTLTGAKGWLKSAKTMFTQALRLDQPMPLSEFANRGQNHGGHSGHGRRDALSPSERTRVLRMLRDEGGRLADEDTKMLRVGDIAPQYASPPPAQPAPAQHHQAPPAQPPPAQPSPSAQHQVPATQAPPQPMRTMFAHGAPKSAPAAAEPQPGALSNARTIMAHNVGDLSASAPPPAQPQPQHGKPDDNPNARTIIAHNAGKLSASAPPPAQSQQGQPDDKPNARTILAGQRRSASLPLQAPSAQTPPPQLSRPQAAGKPDAPAEGDAAATQAMQMRYNDPLNAGLEEPTRVGHMGEFGLSRRSHDDGGLEEPTRSVDAHSILRSSEGEGGADKQPSPHDAKTRALHIDVAQARPRDPNRGSK